MSLPAKSNLLIMHYLISNVYNFIEIFIFILRFKHIIPKLGARRLVPSIESDNEIIVFSSTVSHWKKLNSKKKALVQ
jgi:hypothetical protein